ncbi:hypothetical protein WJX84_001663, partial [Apatococcus fuscideae]
MAAIGGHPDTIAFLLEKGVWTDAYDAHDDTALHIAARKGSLDCIKLLLRHKASATSRNKRSLTPLGEAIVSGHVRAAEFLVNEGGCDPLERQKGWTLLHLAAALGLPECLGFLLQHGCSVHDADNSDGFTPLHCAATGGHVSCVEALSAAKADAAAVSSSDRLAVELLPASASKELRKKLTPGGPRKSRAVPAGQQSIGAQGGAIPGLLPTQTPAEAFRALSWEAQRAQVLRWKEMKAADRPKALVGFPAELESRLKEVEMVQQMVTIQQAIVRLHEDSDFQQDANDPAIEPALDIMRADPQAMERYEGNARMMRVLYKLRGFQSVIAANGRHKVPFPELVVADKPDWRQQDARRAQGMAGMLAAQISAACAAASASSEEEAKAAAAKAAEPPAPSPTPSRPTASANAALASSNAKTPPAMAKPGAAVPASSAAAGPAATAAASSQLPGSNKATSGAPKKAAGSSGAGSAQGSKATKRAGKGQQSSGPAGTTENAVTSGPGASTTAAGGGGDDEDPDRVPSWNEVFTMQKFMKELKRQLYQSVFLVAGLLLFMWWQGMPLPWQEGHPGLAAIFGLGRNVTLPAPGPAPAAPLNMGDTAADPTASFWDTADGA